MIKLLVCILAAISISAQSAETISINSPYGANHPGHTAMHKIISAANAQQSDYNFILELRPGGEQLIAVKYMDEQPQNRLAIIAAKFVENVSTGKLNKDNYKPIWVLGDACWPVITNVGDETKGVSSLKGLTELVVGGVGFGNASHLTALQMGEKYGFRVRYIPFKTAVDATMLMASDNSINMVMDRYHMYEQMKTKNPKMKVLAMSCPTRAPEAPNIPTLQEQGIVAPYIFNMIIANKNMSVERQKEMADVLTRATQTVGLKEIQQASDMRPPQFDNISATAYFDKTFRNIDQLLKKHANQIPAH
jgi:tripartite-type tricarboxylate transporter receptor subunit TctC